MLSPPRFLSLSALLCAFVALGFFTPTSRGEFTITFSQSGSNVVATGSGSLDLTGLISQGTTTHDTAVASSVGFVGLGLNGSTVDAFSGITGPSSFGSGSSVYADSSTGSAVAINGSGFGLTRLFVYDGYQSGTSFTSSATWDGATFASLGLTPGTYTWTWQVGLNATTDSFTVDIPSASAVPEPSSLMLAGTAIGVFGLCMGIRRRRVGAFAV